MLSHVRLGSSETHHFVVLILNTFAVGLAPLSANMRTIRSAIRPPGVSRERTRAATFTHKFVTRRFKTAEKAVCGELCDTVEEILARVMWTGQMQESSWKVRRFRGVIVP